MSGPDVEGRGTAEVRRLGPLHSGPSTVSRIAHRPSVMERTALFDSRCCPFIVDASYYEMMKRSIKPTNRPPKATEGVCEVDQVDCKQVLEAREALPSDTDFQRLADAFRVLANPNRLRVLIALEGRELCVCDLREVLGISMSGTSQVLRELRTLGAVAFRTEGKLAYYRLEDSSWLDVTKSVLQKLTAGRTPVESSATHAQSKSNKP